MSDFWQDDTSELDMLEDIEEVEALAQQLADQPDLVEATDEEIEELVEESAYELDQEQANTIFNARIRLEQAKLYEMLINHDLFEGVDASPQAIKRVQNELKYYIVSRLEILLGIRQPVQPKQEQSRLPLNPVEIDFLKALSAKGTKGASLQAEEEEYEPDTPAPMPVRATTKPKGLKPLAPAAPKKKTVTKTQAKPKPKAQPKAQQQAPLQSSQPKQKPKKNNVDSAHKKIKSDGVLSKRNLSEAEAIAIAKEDIAKSSGKPFHELNAKEKAARVKEVNERHARKPRPQNAVPIPTADQLAATYMTQQTMRSGSQNQMTQFKELLANALVQGNIPNKESE